MAVQFPLWNLFGNLSEAARIYGQTPAFGRYQAMKGAGKSRNNMNLMTILVLAETAHAAVTDLDFVAIFAFVLLGLVVILSLFAFGLSIWLYRQKLHFQSVVQSRQQLLKKCPYCGTFMQPDDSYCPNCGKRVPKVTTVT